MLLLWIEYKSGIYVEYSVITNINEYWTVESICGLDRKLASESLKGDEIWEIY